MDYSKADAALAKMAVDVFGAFALPFAQVAAKPLAVCAVPAIVVWALWGWLGAQDYHTLRMMTTAFFLTSVVGLPATTYTAWRIASGRTDTFVDATKETRKADTDLIKATVPILRAPRTAPQNWQVEMNTPQLFAPPQQGQLVDAQVGEVIDA